MRRAAVPPGREPALIIFDFDGVVADSEVLANQALADFLSTMGRPTTLDQSMHEFMGRRWSDVLPRIEAWVGGPLPESFDADYRAFARPIIRSRVQPVVGVSGFLEQIPAVPRCIASSSSHDWLNFCVDRFDYRQHFGANIFSATDVPNGKPAPDIFLHAAAVMRVAPEQALVIEDSPAGIRGAKAAGMTAIGFLGGSHTHDGHHDQLAAAGADHIVTGYGPLAAWLATRPDTRLPKV